MATPSTDPNIHNGMGPTTVSSTPEQFGRSHLTPSRSRQSSAFYVGSNAADPAPLAVLGLCLSLMPLSCDLMGWRGSGVFGAASVGAYFFEGGFLMVLGGILEFFSHNTFLFTIFTGYGAFWLTYGATLQPFFGAYALYSPDTSDPIQGLSTTGFTASLGFYLLFMAVFSFLACICALRTNLCLVVLEFFLTLFFALLAAAFFLIADGGGDASKVQTASGAFGFVSSIFAWYYFFFAITLVSVDSPLKLPIMEFGRTDGPWGRQAKSTAHHSKETAV